MQKQKIETNISAVLELDETENVVSQIWAEVLQVDKIDPEDNFFELGGDSLMTMMVMFQVNEKLNLDLPPYTISQTPTLLEFCKKVDEEIAASDSTSLTDMQEIDSLELESGVI